jgi:hypothetical protein
MADHEARHANLFGNRPHGQPVESESPQAKRRRHRICRGDLRHRGVEGGIEDGDVRNVRQRVPRVGQRLQRRSIVEGRELTQPVELVDDLVVDDDRLAEDRAAVDDPVRDRVGRLECRDGPGLIAVDE